MMGHVLSALQALRRHAVAGASTPDLIAEIEGVIALVVDGDACDAIEARASVDRNINSMLKATFINSARDHAAAVLKASREKVA